MVFYYLVIYYHNYVFYNSGMVTVLYNRIGRGAELILIIMLAAITKKAQIPFFRGINIFIFILIILSLLLTTYSMFYKMIPLISRFRLNNFYLNIQFISTFIGVNLVITIIPIFILIFIAIPSIKILYLILSFNFPIRILSISIDVIYYGIFFGHCSEICDINHSFVPIVIEATNLINFKI
ncbi:COX2 oxidase, partial [Acromyrmex charruanus]